ncbi:hypothetical protein DLM75_12470 [Leptospira stimsonii]|uniref:Uncharacterized protein n=1 Tax=Leptospira stimsonii TaxID=2202203 RepID=A0A396Z2P5_9LEPT|nr:hypothetical protein DLM75_12470 [Leptospira stimsonii]
MYTIFNIYRKQEPYNEKGEDGMFSIQTTDLPSKQRPIPFHTNLFQFFVSQLLSYKVSKRYQ